jgi:hypothetical protein
LAKALPVCPDVFVGVVRRTQVLGIFHGLAIVMEKVLDLHASSAVAQMDVAKYYDTLPMLRIARWLEQQGVPVQVAITFLRHQMMPRVVIALGPTVAEVRQRTIGGLIASRVAGVCGRSLVETSLRTVAASQAHLAFRLDGKKLVLAGYADSV